MAIGISRFNHVNIRVPKELEGEAKHFYREVLGLAEIDKPDDAKARGGAWYICGDIGIHLSLDENSEARPSQRHVCFEVAELSKAEQGFRDAGVEIIADEKPTAGWKRFYVRDPGGNLLEIAQPV